MTFFFFVVGLEARREFDLGELRERRRFALPLLAGIGGMAVAVAIYLALQRRRSVRARLGRRDVDRHRVRARPARARRAALPRPAARVHAHGRRRRRHPRARRHRDRLHGRGHGLRAARGRSGCSASSSSRRRFGVRVGLVYFALGAAIWVALLESGVEPVVVGLAMGLLAYAYPVARSDLERATERFREFREQPTPELARSVRVGLRSAVSPNERLQLLYHPWTSYLIVPLFALANAGIAIDGAFLERGVHLADHARDPGRLRRRQARRHPRERVAAHATEPRTAPAAGGLGGRRRRRHDRRDRLHRRAARRDARLRRDRSSRRRSSAS